MRKAIIAAIAIASIASAVKADEAINTAQHPNCPANGYCSDLDPFAQQPAQIVKHAKLAGSSLPSVAGSAVASQAQAPKDTRHTFDYPAEYSMVTNAPVSSMKFFGLLGKAHEMRPGDNYEAMLCDLDASALRSKAAGALTVSVSAVKLPDTPCECRDAGADRGTVCTYPNGQMCREPEQGATLCSLDLTAAAGYQIVYREQSGDCGSAAGILASASKRGTCQMLTLVK